MAPKARDDERRERSDRSESATGMTTRLEVSLCWRGKSYPGALTEGTRHRGGKGADRSTGRLVGSLGDRPAPARGGLVEAVGA